MLIALTSTAIAAYFLGSFPTGYLVGRARGVDLRQKGSGNIGATNALRVLGRGPGSFVLLIDALKGFLACTYLPVMLGRCGVYGPTAIDTGTLVPVVGGVFAVLGHNFTCWLRFKGGKGVATSAGVLAGLMPLAFAIVLTVFLLGIAFTRVVSIGSLAAAATLPLAAWFSRPDPILLVLALLLSVLVFCLHRSNISRLRAGTEPRIGQSPAPPAGKPGS